MRLSNFPLNQTGLAWCAITCMIMPDNSNRITLQGCKLLWYPTRGLSMKYKVDALTVPRCRRKTVARKLSRAEIQWVTTPHFIFFFKVKNKLTPDIKYYKLKISSTSHRQYGVLHISSEALLLVWSADTWSRLTFLASYYLLSETHRQLPHTADWTIAATFNLPPRTSAEMFSCASQWFRTN